MPEKKRGTSSEEFWNASPIEKRRYVVSIYEEARYILIHKKMAFDDETVLNFVRETRKRPFARISLLSRAAKYRGRELQKAIQNVAASFPPELSDIREAEKNLDEKYREIDQDPERNRSFLDPVVLTPNNVDEI